MKQKTAISTKFVTTFTLALLVFLLCSSISCNNKSGTSLQTSSKAESAKFVEISAQTLRDKIRGGLLGQILGNLNGLPHEGKYCNEPGSVKEYTPALPEGARTDDDTDIEWTYIYAMQQKNKPLLSPQEITQLWKSKINSRIWCSNLYARQLMDLGIESPLTGDIALNPWADFNISGQFVCETFGLVAPAMPQTAGRIGLNYTRVTIDYEPAQTTQMFTAMIATAFIIDDVDEIIDAGLAAVDSKSILLQITSDVRQWHRQYPNDWRATRRLIKEKYRHFEDTDALRDKNAYELNTACIIAALLYGQGDFTESLRYAFNLGWDADCNAATVGTILGTSKGYRWMLAQGWKICDRYSIQKARNPGVPKTRAGMPEDETITSFADRIIDVAEQVIIEQGGKRITIDGQKGYLIRRQQPANIEPLPDMASHIARMQPKMKSKIENGIAKGTTTQQQARAAYMAICLDLAGDMKQKYPQQWPRAMDALNEYPKVLQVLFYRSPCPLGDKLRIKALAAGLKKPAEWEYADIYR